MGKKKTVKKSTSTTGERRSTNRTTPAAQPPSPPQPQPTPTPEVSPMVQLDRLTSFLRQQDPSKDWAATLADFNRTGGVPAIPTLAPEIPTTVNLPTTIPTSSSRAPEKSSPILAAPSASSKLTPTHQHTEPLYVIPFPPTKTLTLKKLRRKRVKKRRGGKEKRRKN